MQSNLADCLDEFQFTHPVRGATVCPKLQIVAYMFQFTHPVRGATRAHGDGSWGSAVSIHAPREGCDLVRQASHAV